MWATGMGISGREHSVGESMEAGHETTVWGPAWEEERMPGGKVTGKEAGEKGGSHVPENLVC